MLVSIIIPIFNVEKYIERCLFSICSQAYNSMEVVLVDDCTADSSMCAVDLLLKSNSIGYVIIINHPVNSGLSRVKNSENRASTGDYIFFLDSDDELLIDAKLLTGHFSSRDVFCNVF